MKKIILLFSLLLIGFSAEAQKKKKNAKVAIEVDGVCMMCKKRIEKAALGTKGVKFAVWNVKTHMLSLIIDERKTDVKTIQQNIAAVGHDTKEIKAKDHVYEGIDPCCKYRGKEIVEHHKGGKH
ncbi:MAG: metal transporter [Flavobacteriaceae bacterium]|nr:MAG: metal transporter [Flavobacteriaceae bacterium]